MKNYKTRITDFYTDQVLMGIEGRRNGSSLRLTWTSINDEPPLYDLREWHRNPDTGKLEPGDGIQFDRLELMAFADRINRLLIDYGNGKPIISIAELAQNVDAADRAPVVTTITTPEKIFQRVSKNQYLDLVLMDPENWIWKERPKKYVEFEIDEDEA